MTELYSQYTSGTQFTAGTIAGSALGVSGLNPVVDRLNSISTADNLITGSLISGTTIGVYGTLSGTEFVIHASGNSGFSKTSYASYPPSNIIPDNQSIAYELFDDTMVCDEETYHLPISLPHNSILTSIAIYGSGIGSFSIRHQTVTGALSSYGLVALNGSRTCFPSNPLTINNDTYSYSIIIPINGSGTKIFGGRAEYTTD